MVVLELRQGFSEYSCVHPEKKSGASRVCRALLLEGFCTMEELMLLYCHRPEDLLSVRDIGPGRLELIQDILRFYQSKAPPGSCSTVAMDHNPKGAFSAHGAAVGRKPLHEKS